jgi:hypothetical protein
MKTHIVLRSLLGTAALIVFLLALSLLLRPALAAPHSQQDTPLLTIVKTADGAGTIGPGQTILFTVAISNTGTVSATNVVVQDDYDQVALPTIKVLSDTEAGTGSAQNDGDVITWQLGDLAPGTGWNASYEATAAEAFESGITEVANVASVQADNVEESLQATVVLTVQAPQLTLTLERERVDGEGEITPGDAVRYTLRYNNGAVRAPNVILEATFDETVVQQVTNVSHGGQQDGTTVRWDLGDVAAGASGEVSYEIMLKPSLSQGDIEVQSEAIVRADGMEAPASASVSFILRTPLLIVERERVDLNGGMIAPGDTLRFTIRVRNAGAVTSRNVVVRDDFDERVVAEVSDISSGGTEGAGVVEWQLTELMALEPGVQQTFSYKARLESGISESTKVANTAIILINDVEMDRTQTTMTIEPAAEPGKQISWLDIVLATLVGVSVIAALVAVCVLALRILVKEGWKERYFGFVIEGIAIVIVAEAVLVLAISENIESDGAVSILSSIVGYVLGRSMSGIGSRRSDTGSEGD